MSLEAATVECITAWATVGLAAGTLVLALVAIFPDTVRRWFYRPNLEVSIQTQPPDCVAVPITITRPAGQTDVNAFYLRLWVKNTGNTTAKTVEVYAEELLRRRADDTWESVKAFPPMNLPWSYIHSIYFGNIVPETGKHCDLGHIVDPARRAGSLPHEENPRLGLSDRETSLSFDVVAPPNHKGHIVGPGEYRLRILIAAENVRRPAHETVSISLKGGWFADETQMSRDGVGVTIEPKRWSRRRRFLSHGEGH
jgi:hypothetical protein